MDLDLQECRASFRRRPVGWWSNELGNEFMTSCPTSREVGFFEDGRASVNGGVLSQRQMTFEWREYGDFEIEVRAKGEEWQRVSYEFRISEGQLVASFTEHSIELGDAACELIIAPLQYSGPPRQ